MCSLAVPNSVGRTLQYGAYPRLPTGSDGATASAEGGGADRFAADPLDGFCTRGYASGAIMAL